jgi:hypothetical protein
LIGSERRGSWVFYVALGERAVFVFEERAFWFLSLDLGQDFWCFWEPWNMAGMTDDTMDTREGFFSFSLCLTREYGIGDTYREYICL